MAWEKCALSVGAKLLLTKPPRKKHKTHPQNKKNPPIKKKIAFYGDWPICGLVDWRKNKNYRSYISYKL